LSEIYRRPAAKKEDAPPPDLPERADPLTIKNLGLARAKPKFLSPLPLRGEVIPAICASLFTVGFSRNGARDLLPPWWGKKQKLRLGPCQVLVFADEGEAPSEIFRDKTTRFEK
jgi:hypothetical protein